MEISKIISIAEYYNFIFHEYKENGFLCGYEMETWTDGGVNMIHFIDFRKGNYPDGLTPQNVLEELKKISAYFDPDEEVELHRQGDSYRKAFSIREAIDDFDAYNERLAEFVRAVQAAFDA